MGIEVRVDHKSKVLFASVSGSFTNATLLDLVTAIRKSVKSHKVHSMIIDWSGVNDARVSAQAIRDYAVSPSSQRISCVHVAPQDHIYGLARMFQIAASATRPRTMVVRSMEEACRMVGVDAQSA